MPRFVILFHELPPESDRASHWDLMLEDGDTLATWALEDSPAETKSTAAIALAPHRLRYLDYEGPVSNQRGHVTRWEHGTFEWLTREDNLVRVQLHGNQQSRVVRLEKQDNHWVAAFMDET